MSIDYETTYADVVDINVLKQKRRSRRSAITRQDSYLSTLFKTPLQEVKPAEIASKLSKLKDLVNEHEVLQNCIDDITTPSEDDTEYVKDNQLLLRHSKMLDDLENVYIQHQIWCSGSCIRHDADILISTSSLNTEACRDSYEKLKVEYKDFVTSAHSYFSCPDIKTLADEVDDLMRKLLDKASNDFEPKVTSTVESSSSATSIEPVLPRFQSRLKLDLPTFSGDLLDWHEFWSIFSARMSRENGLSEHEKISCLENSMSDKGAKAIVRVHGVSGSFSECVKALQERYDRNKIVYRHHVQKLSQLKPVQDTYESLCQTIQDLTRHTCGMKSCDGASFEQLIVAMIEPLLPTVLSKLWSDFTSESNSPPPLADLFQFLKRRSQAVEAIIPTKPAFQSQTPMRNKPKALHVRGQNQERCPCCDSNHSIYQCLQFRGLTVDKKYNIARRHHLCFNCLNKSHSIENCPSKNTCKECGRKHHSLMHKPEAYRRTNVQSQCTTNQSSTFVQAVAPTGVSTAPVVHSGASTSVNTPPGVTAPTVSPSGVNTALYQQQNFNSLSTSFAYMPATALATVSVPDRQCKARVLMDTGSGITLISSRLAQSLKAKKQRLVHEITGLNGTKCLTSKYVVNCTLSSAREKGSEEVTIQAHVVNKITSDYGPQDLSEIRALPFLAGKKLADPEFGQSGRIDLLLSIADSNRCTFDQSQSTPDRSFRTWNSVFGWIVGGQTSSFTSSSSCMNITATSDLSADEILQRFWLQEEVPKESMLRLEDREALDNFESTTTRNSQGRYSVSLPRRTPCLSLGESRSLALKRYQQNKRSLTKKDQWQAFHLGLDEYRAMGHAELVPRAELHNPKRDIFYLPTHGVIKESSTTTKLRIVFDGSAISSNGRSLNDILLQGPSLYPLLSTVIAQFRRHKIGMSADISKMFREVDLAESDRDLHRFLHEDSNGEIQDWRMCRVTFGITSSPFLATKVLLQVAEDHKNEFPQAAAVVQQSFYVDDCLTGASSITEAKQLRSDLNSLLSLACFTLRKWRSNSQELLADLPTELKEVDNSNLMISPSECPKTLGLHWNTSTDTLHVCTTSIVDIEVPTKRQLASAVGKTFDIMGWYSSVTVMIKIMLQQVWKNKIGWDEPLPSSLLPVWEKWSKDLHLITEHPIPRKYDCRDSPVIQKQLHGYCDASQSAYGAVVYLRLLHQDSSVSISLITAKTKVAPLNGSTIPRLELSGALLLARLIHQTSKDLDIPISNIFAWCDSSVVLGWLNMAPTRLKVYIANRVMETTKLLPAEHWRYVSTKMNPADLASRGVHIQQLLDSDLWWQGPEWLLRSTEDWPRRPDINLSRELPELKSTVLLILKPAPNFDLWNRFSSFHKLVAITAWIRRFVNNALKINIIKEDRLSSSELCAAKTKLISLSQSQSYNSEVYHLTHSKPIPIKSSIYSLFPLIDQDGVLRVGGRLNRASVSSNVKHSIILSKHHPLTKCLVLQIHSDSGHAGIGAMLAILADNYYICGLKSLLRLISRSCVICQRSYAKTAEQLMGQLPPERLLPSSPFTYVGIDYAGPLWIKRGNPRKPILVKVYVCLFVCFSTKAIHIELASDLTTEAFLAALNRFVARRGVPKTILSDNGSNFVGAKNELSELYSMLRSKQTLDAIHYFSASKFLDWKFSPSRSPHFGGMWEAGIKSMKTLLRKRVGDHRLTFEELTTVLAEVEATLNSRPLLPIHSTSPDGSEVLTAGHFLIGRPLHSLPSKIASSSKMCNLRRWNLVNRLSADLWDEWHHIYLQSLQKRNKWQGVKTNLMKDDIVLLKDDNCGRRVWPLAKIVEVHPGSDGLVRVVSVLCNGKKYKRSVEKLVLLLKGFNGASPSRECVQASRTPGGRDSENGVGNR